MEEDIKILERYLEKIDRSKASFNRFRFLKALENLIKYYVEQNEVNARFIPKSKIKEKIEELNNMIKEINKRKTSKVHSRRDYSF